MLEEHLEGRSGHHLEKYGSREAHKSVSIEKCFHVHVLYIQDNKGFKINKKIKIKNLVLVKLSKPDKECQCDFR